MHTMCRSWAMKVFDWSIEKNEWLREVRGITFEEIVFHVQGGTSAVVWTFRFSIDGRLGMRYTLVWIHYE